MQEVKAGDIVLLHHTNDSATPQIVINVLSPTEVQVTNPNSGLAFHKETAPVYSRETGFGQWEPMNNIPDDFKNFVENIRMINHPLMSSLQNIVKLPPDIEDMFSKIQQLYASKDMKNPFYEVKLRSEPTNAEYLYEILMSGVQEGLRSTLYFLQQFLQQTNLIKILGTIIINDIKPTHSGTLGINAYSLNANFEGFTLLNTATLDRLKYFFCCYFQFDPKKVPNLNILKQKLSKEHGNYATAQKFVNMINKHNSFLDTQFGATERNRIAHQEYVGFAYPNIMYSPDGVVRIILIYKEDLEADAAEELTERFNKLKLFIIDVLTEFFALS